MPTEPEFPFEAARDLLGVLRVLWTDEREQMNYSKEKLASITSIARALKNAISLAAGHDPGTAPYRKAMNDAEGAVKRLADIYVTEYSIDNPVPRILEVAGRRVTDDRKPWKRTRNDETILQRMKRG